MIILPSLEIVPAKYSGSTLLSQIPIDGTGDFTVSRTTSPVTGRSTRVNSLGLIETVNDNVPRLDYPLGGAVNGCPALLVEPSAQNQMIQSQDLSLAFPSQNNTTPSANVSISPDGTQNADRLTFVTTGGYRLRNFSIVSGTSYTATLFYKNVDFTTGNIFSFQVSDGVVAAMRVNINPVTNTITQATGPFTNVSSSIENYGNGWYRVRISGTASNTGGGWYELVTNAAKSIDLWGFQFETGLVATSYIPTTTQPITRAADAISDTTATALIGQTEGTIYFEAQCFTPNDFSDIIQIQGVGNNVINIIQNANNAYRMDLTASGVSRIITSTVTGVTGFAKIAIAYKTNDLAISVNGGAPTTLASGFTFDGALTTIRIAHANYTALRPYRLRAAAIYPTRLTDTQLALLTSPYTSYSSMASALSYTLG